MLTTVDCSVYGGPIRLTTESTLETLYPIHHGRNYEAQLAKNFSYVDTFALPWDWSSEKIEDKGSMDDGCGGLWFSIAFVLGQV